MRLHQRPEIFDSALAQHLYHSPHHFILFDSTSIIEEEEEDVYYYSIEYKIQFKMELQYTYSPSKFSMARDTRGGGYCPR